MKRDIHSGGNVRKKAIAEAQPWPQAEILSSTPEQLANTAHQLDGYIRSETKAMRQSITKLGAMLTRMRDERLWQWLPRFRTFEDYTRDVLGDMARGKIYELMAAFGLTHGEHSLSAEIVEKLGTKKAVELSRLEPADRTEELVRAALEDTVPALRQKVHEKLNEAVPSMERKELLIPFGRHLPIQVIELIEEIEEDGTWLEGVRDGDKSLPLRAKLWFAVWTNFRANYADELEHAHKHRIAETGSSAECDHGQSDEDSEENSLR